MSLSRTLIEFALALDAVPQPVGHAVRRHLLDGAGNAVASARLGAVDAAVTVAAELGGPPQSSLLGTSVQVGAPAAAFATGTMIHGFDFDDTHAGALVHATAVVLPVALALGEQLDRTIDELVPAAAAGYEVLLRLGAAVPHGFHARGFHATSVVGVYGATVLAGRLLGLSADELVAAVGIAGSRSAGSLEFLRSEASTKQLHPGFAAMDGILAARLAQAGATGPPSILEGQAGLYRLYTGQDVDPSAVTDGLGDRWELEAITIKPYPVCQLSHAALDAAGTVRDQLPELTRIRRIEVDLPSESVPIVAGSAPEKVRPRTTYQARFALPFCLAVLLSEGAITTADLGPAQLGRADLQELAGRVEIRPIEVPVPAAAAPGSVRIVLDDGRTVHGQVPVSQGGPDRPMTDDTLIAKAVANLGGDPEVARHLAAQLLDADASWPVRELARRLSEAARPAVSSP